MVMPAAQLAASEQGPKVYKIVNQTPSPGALKQTVFSGTTLT